MAALLREVGNGGFGQFFVNSSKRWAFFVETSLTRMARPDAARVVRRAVRAVGKITGHQLGPGIGTAFDELNQKMSRPNPRRGRTFEECDNAFWQLRGVAESALA